MAALAVAILSVPVAGALAMPSDEPVVEQPAMEEPAMESVVEDQATEDQATEEQATEDQATEEQATEDQATEEQVTEEQAATASLSDEQMEEARTIFANWSCGACHVMGDANGTGHIGPSLDGNNAMDEAFIISRVTNGQGAMPGFGGQLTDEEIALLATYIMEAKR